MWYSLLYVLPLVAALTDDELALFTPRIPGLVERNTGEESTVYAVDNGDGSLSVVTNGVPSHETGWFPSAANPTSLRQQFQQLKIFKEPVMRAKGDELTCLPRGGPIGIATSGVFIYSGYASEEGCPFAAEVQQSDVCEGHPDEQGVYHYNQFSPCVQVPVCGVESPLYGVALDGIPIYGPIGEEGRQLTRADLDKCGGKYDSYGRYRYHVTVDPPYFPTCFKAELRRDLGLSASLPAEAFTCTCPHDDTFTASERVCDFSGSDRSQPAQCADRIPDNATVSSVYEQVHREISLAGCCPEGADCGERCGAEGAREECVVERVTVAVWERREKRLSCWEGCYAECVENEECNCKRKCKRRCIANNGYSDRKKRASPGAAARLDKKCKKRSKGRKEK